MAAAAFVVAAAVAVVAEAVVVAVATLLFESALRKIDFVAAATAAVDDVADVDACSRVARDRRPIHDDATVVAVAIVVELVLHRFALLVNRIHPHRRRPHLLRVQNR